MVYKGGAMTQRAFLVSCVLGGALLAALAFSQISYDEGRLAVKRRFAENEIAAIAEPFRGVATSSGIEHGLFSIRPSGVSTDPIREDATSFLSTLTEEQQIRTIFSVEAPEWRRWSNVDNGIYVRQGVSLEEMTDDQKDAAWGLLQSSLSPKGLALSRNIMIGSGERATTRSFTTAFIVRWFSSSSTISVRWEPRICAPRTFRRASIST